MPRNRKWKWLVCFAVVFVLWLIIYAVIHLYFEPLKYPAKGAVTNATKAEICTPGYSESARPPEIYSWAIKEFATLTPQKYELDHRVPICLGGSPYSLENLQLQPWGEAKIKDESEEAVCWAVCHDQMTLEAAQRMFMNGDSK